MAVDIIVYPQEVPRLILIPSPQTTVTVQELVNAIRDWEDSEVGLAFDYLMNASGKEDLGGGLAVGITLALNNAQLQFEPVNTIHTNGLTTTADANGHRVYDSLASFTTDGLHVGDVIYNYSAYAMSTLLEVVSDTELRGSMLIGGSRQDWQLGDTYQVYHTLNASITGGNLVATDSVGATIDPLLPAANVSHTIDKATSAALLEAGSLTSGDIDSIADAVWDEATVDHTSSGSFGEYISKIPLIGKLIALIKGL